MSDVEKRLGVLIKERSLKTDGPYRLASGGTSHYYIDGKLTEVFSEAAHLIGEVLYERTKDAAIDAIGGLEVGAVPLTTSTVISYHLHGRKMEGFWVRNQVKTHGTQKMVEGNLKPGSRIAVIDDVVTQGNSTIKAIRAVRDKGCEVVLVLALVDRLCGAEQLFRAEGIKNYRQIFTIRDLGVEPDAPRTAESLPVREPHFAP